MADRFGLLRKLAFTLFAVKHVDMCRNFKKYLQSNVLYTIFYAKSMELVPIYL
jgi:hypothetical protein